jgi:SpoIID/LytB domain protein
VRGSQKTATIDKELPIRRALGGLPSALFTVHKSAKGGVTRFTFTGGGRGHGVGLCQQGARGMALHGLKYRDILQHYYSGVALARVD